MSVTDPWHVVVVLPDGQSARLDTVQDMLSEHVRSSYAPCPAYPVRSRGLRDALRRRGEEEDLLVVDQWNGMALAAGGRLSRLDLDGLAIMRTEWAHARWWAWHDQVAVDTPRAREWSSYLAEARRAPREFDVAEARRRFEGQPRVLAMLAAVGERRLGLDLEDLPALQAGEAVYVALSRQQALFGQMLVVPGGLAYQPVSDGIADRLRYLAAAADVVQALPPHQHLAAMARIPTL